MSIQKFKNLGFLNTFWALKSLATPPVFYLCKRKYTLNIIAKAGLIGAKPASTPMETNHNLAKVSGSLFAATDRYRWLIGKLIYLTITRPELGYSIHILVRFMHNPRLEYWDAALRVVRFLKRSPGQGIMLRSDSPLTLTAYCDSDWAACPLTCRSITGYFLLLLKQNTVRWQLLFVN